MKPLAPLLLLFAALPAQAQEAIVLDCRGQEQADGKTKPYREIFYLDLHSRRYCQGECRASGPILSFDANRIDFSWPYDAPKDDEPVTPSISLTRVFDRNSRILDMTYTVSAARLSRRVTRARCEVAPLVLEPVLRFLREPGG